MRLFVGRLAVLLAVLGIFWLAEHPVQRPVTSVLFEIADTEEEREQGLSQRTEVPKEGMLFVFAEVGNYGIWMKDMLISIDIIWIRSDGIIVGVEHNVSPDTYPDAFYPPEPVRYVLETKVGDAKARGWDVGARIPLP